MNAVRERVVSALASPRAAESRVAALLIARLGPTEHASRLRDLLLSTTLPHVRIHVLRVSARLSKWPRLDLLLRAAALGDATLHALATDHLREWLQRVNRSFVVPTGAERDSIGAAPAAAPDLHPDRVIELRRVLDAT